MIFFQFVDSIRLLYSASYTVLTTPEQLAQDNMFCYIWAGVIFFILFAFQAAALYRIACREHYKFKWMAFIPVVSTFYIGYCSRLNPIYNFKTHYYAIIVACAELIYIIASILTNVSYGMLIPWMRVGVESAAIPYNSISIAISIVPQELSWCVWIQTYLTSLVEWILVICSVLFALLNISFFRTYSASRYLIFVIFSILVPINGIFMFAVSGNKAVNYVQYIRAQQERAYRIRQQFYQQQNPYNQNPYNQNPYNQNPYNQNPYQKTNTNTYQDPFAQYGNAKTNSSTEEKQSTQQTPPRDPFDEF